MHSWCNAYMQCVRSFLVTLVKYFFETSSQKRMFWQNKKTCGLRSAMNTWKQTDPTLKEHQTLYLGCCVVHNPLSFELNLISHKNHFHIFRRKTPNFTEPTPEVIIWVLRYKKTTPSRCGFKNNSNLVYAIIKIRKWVAHSSWGGLCRICLPPLGPGGCLPSTCLEPHA